MTEPLLNHDDHGGVTAVYVQAPQWHRASGVTGIFAIDIKCFWTFPECISAPYVEEQVHCFRYESIAIDSGSKYKKEGI